MNVNTLVLGEDRLTAALAAVEPRPQTLYGLGADIETLLALPRVAIVGSRKVSSYGRSVTAQLAGELAAYGIVIVSGLALGVDGLAHRAALEAGGLTIAVMPCGLERIYPANHYSLGQQIIRQGGALISEYAAGTETYKVNFIARNRLIAALADVTLITEAAEKSGSLHTARFALEQGKDVLAVPGNITSPTSVGTNNLIRAGATPVTSTQDVLDALGLTAPSADKIVRGGSNEEQLILDLLAQDIGDGAELLLRSRLPVMQFNQTLTMMEITGKVRPLGGNTWAIR